MSLLNRLIGRRETPFATALRTYGFENCAINGPALLIGLPPHENLAPLTAIPPDLTRVEFLAAPHQADLITTFCNSPESGQIETLTVGTSHHFAEQKHPLPYDMSPAIKALDQPLPKVKTLSLGDMLQLFNGGQYYGRLGAIDRIFHLFPALENLQLFGQFSLNSPCTHNGLKTIEATADSIGVSGGPIAQSTVTHLLDSKFENLTRLFLELEEEDAEEPYAIPSTFPDPARLPNLGHIHIDPIPPEAQNRLKP